MRSVPARLIFVLIAAFLTLTACSEDTTPAGGDTDTETTGGDGGSIEADAYGAAVCTAMGDWMDAIEERGAAYEEQASEISGPEDLEAVRDALATFAAGVVDDTEVLIDEVESLGVPDVADGQAVRDGIIEGFTSARDLFAQLEEAANTLDPNDPQAMTEAMTELASSMQEGGQELQESFEAMEESGLGEGFSDDIEECQELAT